MEVAVFLAIVIALYALLWRMDRCRHDGPTWGFDPDDPGKPIVQEELDRAA